MTTTFLTVRQSMKRGMMPAATPDNPMGQSQKYMMYIMPFFALSGLYWPFGLVLYWVTTNCGRWCSSGCCSGGSRSPTAAGAAGAVTAPAVAPVGDHAAEAPGQVPGPRPRRSQDAVGRRPVERRGKARCGPAELERRSARQRAARLLAPRHGSAAKTSGPAGPRGPARSRRRTAAAAGGMLRRLGKRAEPEPEPPEPEVKLVRQQRSGSPAASVPASGEALPQRPPRGCCCQERSTPNVGGPGREPRGKRGHRVAGVAQIRPSRAEPLDEPDERDEPVAADEADGRRGRG